MNKMRFFSAPSGDELATNINFFLEDNQKDIEVISFDSHVNPENDARRYTVFLLYRERGGPWWQLLRKLAK